MSDSELPAWVAKPELAVSWARVVARFEAAGLVPRGSTVVELATRAQRHAGGELLGISLTRVTGRASGPSRSLVVRRL